MLANRRSGFAQLDGEQTDAWGEEVEVLQRELRKLCSSFSDARHWGLLLEFPIPRRQRRIDAVILAGKLIFVLEFKSGSSGALWSSGQQVEDYALDLSYFHAPSHGNIIIPAVIAPDLPYRTSNNVGGNVRSVATVPTDRLCSFLRSTSEEEQGTQNLQINLLDWDEGDYEPVPTVIEAAMALYAGMSVREIARSHAGEENLTAVADFLLNAISSAQANSEKIICFVTGIPGAGKTLAGLNVVHNREIQSNGRPASVFMSGNGPLVDILREALALDFARRRKAETGKGMLGKARSEVKTFVQNIHHFVDYYLGRTDEQPAYEHAIVFDEAQRAWNAEQNRKKYKKKPLSWHVSEPEMILRVMDRHEDWAAVIALVGGGQEIHDGEAGLAEWGKALDKFPHWRVMASPEALEGGDSVGGASLFGDAAPRNAVTKESSLHLDVCIRAHQATELAAWVNCVLNGEQAHAAKLSSNFQQFPILMTRDLASAKQWLLKSVRGERRCGLVASSGATRLRAHGIETSMAIREAYSYPDWFLKDRGDTRSSYQLEVVATEFEIQGLELDMAALCWGGDLVWDPILKQWHPFKFVGNSWKEVNEGRSIYIRNKYRVLMTRAREGLMIWVPEGDPNDLTRNPEAMNQTAEFLVSCGVKPLR